MRRNRAWRRHQKFRIRGKALRILHLWFWGPHMTEEDILDKARYMADNMKICGFDCCCNPRHSGHTKGKEKLTIQERRYLVNDFY
jgi:hypothetical protein